jgi:predicted kinase
MLGQKGVLELTWWPNERRLWFKVAKNRHAPWIDVALPKFAFLLEHDLTQ